MLKSFSPQYNPVQTLKYITYIDITYKAYIITESELHNLPLQAFDNLLPILKCITVLNVKSTLEISKNENTTEYAP